MSNAAYSCRGGIVVRKYVSVVVVSAKFIVVVVGVCGECWMILVGFSKVKAQQEKIITENRTKFSARSVVLLRVVACSVGRAI
jgi:hypothetical protein